MQDNGVNSGKYFKEIITGIYPFNVSNKRVIAANNLFPVLNTFVAPIFPEPIFLISFFINNLVKISPNGIDPQKYEKIKIIIISIIYYTDSYTNSPFKKVFET